MDSHVVRIHAGQEPKPSVAASLHQSRKTNEVDDRRCQPKDKGVQVLKFPLRMGGRHCQSRGGVVFVRPAELLRSAGLEGRRCTPRQDLVGNLLKQITMRLC